MTIDPMEDALAHIRQAQLQNHEVGLSFGTTENGEYSADATIGINVHTVPCESMEEARIAFEKLKAARDEIIVAA